MEHCQTSVLPWLEGKEENITRQGKTNAKQTQRQAPQDKTQKTKKNTNTKIIPFADFFSVEIVKGMSINV